MGDHGYRYPRDPQMPGPEFDTRDVLRHIIAPAAGDVTKLRVQQGGRGLDGKEGYAYIPLRSRVNIDRLLTLIKNCAAFNDVTQLVSKTRAHKLWLQPFQPVRDRLQHPCWQCEAGTRPVCRH